MNELKTGDIFVGVKAEQSLRDAVRQAGEADERFPLELTPVGRKDWIAGKRFSSPLTVGDISSACREVYLQLIELPSQQRIRTENLRLHAVQPHVPVFMDGTSGIVEPDGEAHDSLDGGSRNTAVLREEKDDLKAVEKSSRKRIKGGPMVCPVCGRTVHSYNLHYNTHGRIVGCFLCGGRSSDF